MAKCVFICSREPLPRSMSKKLGEVCNRLCPDNISPAEPKVFVEGEIGYGIINPNSTIRYKDTSFLMGQIVKIDNDWNIPCQDFPDGSYALFRNSKDYCEIVSDPVASRTIWYYMDTRTLIAATSQRAIIMLLDSFSFNENVITWMLSTGTLGPGFSWDKRIKRLGPESSIILDKKKWELSIISKPIEFKEFKRPDEKHEEMLRESLASSFKDLNPDCTKWALPLSGGYDSRGILWFLLEANPENKNITTITWGLRSSMNAEGNDASVAKQLADNLSVKNKYYVNDLSEEPIKNIIDRFVRLGEGQIDNISDYLDGFKMWKDISEDGIEGIIRGDEGFGCKHYSSSLAVKNNQSCIMCSDLQNLKNYKKYGFPDQELPEDMHQRKGESLSTWRDRLFHSYTLPTGFSPLSDLKLGYVEQINPLLTREILKVIRQLPDHLRTEKKLFKKIVDTSYPKVKYAKSASSAPLSELLRNEKLVNFMKDELSSTEAKLIFPDTFLKFIINGIQIKTNTSPGKHEQAISKSLIKKMVPLFLKEVVRSKILLPSIDNNILAFRVVLICKTYRLLNEDCKLKIFHN